MGRSDAVREHEGEAARSCLVDDHSPRLPEREQREDVACDVRLDDLLPREITGEDRTDTDGTRELLELLPPEPAPTRRRDTGGPAIAAARTSVSSPFSGARRATQRTPTSSGSSPNPARSSARRAASRSARSPNPATSIVFANVPISSGLAPRASIESRASDPAASTPEAPRTTCGTTAPFTARRQPARGPWSWLSTSRTYGTQCRRHHTTAAWDATCSSRRRRRRPAVPV